MKVHRRKRKQATTRAERRHKNPDCLPTKFEPRFLEMADKRIRAVRIIRERLERLINEAGCDTLAKETLAKEAIFLSVQLETIRTRALEGETFDQTAYIQGVNALSGLLSKLGLEQTRKRTKTLAAYVAEEDED